MIGTKIKSIRELKNLTQEHIADRLHISQAAYSRLENGESKISDERLSQIADVLEVKPEDIQAFDSQKYFNSNGNIEGSYSGSIILGMRAEEVQLLKKLYEDKISLLERLLSKSEKENEKYKSKYGEL